MHCTIKTHRQAGNRLIHLMACMQFHITSSCYKLRKGWLHSIVAVQMPKAGRELMTGRAFRWASALPQIGNKKKKERKQVNNRCDWMNWKIWKGAKRENANECVGEQWRSGDGVEQQFSAVIKMTCWRGGGGKIVSKFSLFPPSSRSPCATLHMH